MRCLSAADIALWDIKAQAAGMPLWQLLGGVRERIAASMAGGYPRPGRTLDSLGEEVARYAAQGYPWIKIAAGPLADDTERLARVRRRRSATACSPTTRTGRGGRCPTVVPTVRTWDEFDLAFIEDPFPSESPRLAAGLRERTGIPLALGEDVTGRYAYRDLIARGAAGHPAPRRDDDGRDQRGDQDLRDGRGRVDPRPAPHLPRAPRPPRGRAADRDGRRGDRSGAGDRPPVEHPGEPAPAGRRATSPRRPGRASAPSLDRAALARYTTGVETLRA